MWERLDNAGKPFAAAGLTRFRRLGFLPKLSVDKLVNATADAIEADRRFVRLPKRYGGYHALSNAPRRLVEGALLGVKFPPEWETHIEPEGR